MTSSAVERHARHLPGFEQRLLQTLQALRDAAQTHAGRIVQTTSLGAEDMVLTDLIARHALAIPVATLQTGRLHDETLALIPRVEARYGLSVEQWLPEAAQVVHFADTHGAMAMRESVALRQACCALRKLQPLSRALQGRTAWITGLRREQSAARAEVLQSSVDPQGRTKLNPLADWQWADVWHYIGLHRVPYNPLHDAHFPSIGCEPCTRALAMGEDFRAGRWWWEQETARECGIHGRGLHTQKESAT